MLSTFTQEDWNVCDEYCEMFKSGLPTMMIPESETTEGLIMNLKLCIERGEDILMEIYGFVNDENIYY